jgi:F0F1-type ATP synthase assembly protein I
MNTNCQKCQQTRRLIFDWIIVIVLGVLLGWAATNWTTGSGL